MGKGFDSKGKKQSKKTYKDYHSFLNRTLKIIKKRRNNPKIIYQYIEDNQDWLDRNFAEFLQHWADKHFSESLQNSRIGVATKQETYKIIEIVQSIRVNARN